MPANRKVVGVKTCHFSMTFEGYVNAFLKLSPWLHAAADAVEQGVGRHCDLLQCEVSRVVPEVCSDRLPAEAHQLTCPCEVCPNKEKQRTKTMSFDERMCDNNPIHNKQNKS